MSRADRIVLKHVSHFSTSLLGGIFLSAVLSGTAYAQDDPAATPATAASQAKSNDGGIEDIVVTARRRNESLLSTPVSITALTGTQLTAAGIISMQDVVNFIPGANFVGMATEGGRADRSFASIVLRGVNPSSSVLQTTSLFIDGVPVTSAISLQAITDPARVEVLKGPQSAYFGRETFAGAINVVTRDPVDHWTGSINAMVGTRANRDFWAELSGPLTDTLSVAATVRDYGKNGSYQNAALPSQNLGSQSTFSGTVEVVYKPTYNLTFKAFGLYTSNDDGPAVTGLISAYGVTSADGATVVPDLHNCTFPTGNNFICGKLPILTSSQITTTALNDPFIRASLANGNGRYIKPGSGTQGIGLASQYYHGHFVADWKVTPSLTLSSLTGYDHQMFSEIADYDNYDGTGLPTPSGNEANFNFPYLVEGISKTFSEEVRASFDHGPVRASIGGSYLYAWSVGDGGPAAGATGSYTPFNPQFSKTYGIFGNLSYDITSQLTLNAEGRYQIEKSVLLGQLNNLTVINGDEVIGYNQFVTSSTFRNFLPRVIGQFKIDPKNMLYASWSKGVNPSQFNQLLTLPVAQQQEAAALGAKLNVLPELMTNYEIGAKGLLFGNRVRYTVAGFFMYWDHQADQQLSLYFTPGNPLPQQLIYDTNNGRVRITGVEADLAADVTHQLNLEVNAAYIDSYILGGTNASVTGLTGITDFRGKSDPFTSKYSATVTATYTVPLTPTISGYLRADFTYKSGVFTDVGNTTWTPDSTNTNLRIGARTATWTVEAYATNLFNNRAYYAAGDSYTADPTFSHFTQFSAVVAQLRDLRTVGARISHSF